jgi:hypothetical protein
LGVQNLLAASFLILFCHGLVLPKKRQFDNNHRCAARVAVVNRRLHSLTFPLNPARPALSPRATSFNFNSTRWDPPQKIRLNCVSSLIGKSLWVKDRLIWKPAA